ncbi:lysine--tRNA ligase [Abyssisolibacter fermentans]|uniref:lysine--tRNA ligase n=1 Tax=Abyssisolibacter fermentans TaxID=1766203 RepID=UPI00083782F8|nr:lysine--tRNA ligase [Abyssisolibacter fermentans]
MKYDDLNNLKEIIPDANEMIVERIKKSQKLKDLNTSLYPYSYKKTSHSIDIINDFNNIKENDSFSIAGRIMLLRNMGSSCFANLRDQEGDIQVYFNKKNLGLELYNIIKLFDIGDIIGVEGNVFKTKTDEITLRAFKVTLLSKSIRPLPEKYHGLQDSDLKQRHRSLDMIMNKEVKKRFINRAKAMSAIREYLNNKGFIEIDTPILDTKYGGGEAKPFSTYVNALNCEVFMNISPELYLKRLMVGGLERVYSFSRSFRNEGIDRTHYPEFTLFECYMAYADYNDMMALMEQLYEYVFTKVLGSTKISYNGISIDFKVPWRRASMCDLIKENLDISIENLSKKEIVKIIKEKNISINEELSLEELSKSDLIMSLFDDNCVDGLIQPTFVIDFPKDSSPLCKTHRQNNELIERFEPYAYGVELGNAYSELNDPLAQRILLNDQAKKLRAGFETASPMDEEFAKALDIGMPPAGGLGIGIDRMIMFLTNTYSIKDVIAFPLVKR